MLYQKKHPPAFQLEPRKKTNSYFSLHWYWLSNREIIQELYHKESLWYNPCIIAQRNPRKPLYTLNNQVFLIAHQDSMNILYIPTKLQQIQVKANDKTQWFLNVVDSPISAHKHRYPHLHTIGVL